MSYALKAFGRHALLICALILLSSHELFLKSDTYFLAEDADAELYLFNGTFDGSENVITRDRIVEDRILGPDLDLQLEDAAYFDKGKATYLTFKTKSSGTYVAGVSTLPRMIDMSAKEFLEYLEHEELTDLISKRAQQGISELPVREKYSKHVKSLLQVGEQRTQDFGKALGYPIEFVPVQNPYALKVGDQVSFKLLFQGKPLASHTVHVSSRPSGIDPFAEETVFRTDAEGVVSFVIKEAGAWYLATIHIEESSVPGVDYESNWATITFGVK